MGRPDPDAMRAQMPYRTWRGWVEYNQIEPFGEERADLRVAQLAAIMANAWRKKGSRRYKIDDFMFDFGSRRRARTPDELAQQVFAINKLFGGEFIDKRKETG
jgi:hypothetical protein